MIAELKLLIKNLFHSRFIEILALLFLALVFFHQVILHPNYTIFPASDIVGQYSFWRQFLSDSINTYHQIPLWNPFSFSGTPFQANPLAAIFYPITWLFILLPIKQLFGFIFLLDVFLIGLFTYLFGFELTANRKAAFVGAITFMFSGYVILRIYPGHLANMDVIVWFCSSMLFCHSLLMREKLSNALLLGISLALMLLAGHLQFTFYGAFTILVYTILLIGIVKKFRINKRLIALLSLALFIAFGLSAVQLLPSLELSQLTNRAGGTSFEFSSSYSLSKSMLILYLLPNFFGNPVNFWGVGNFWELNLYVGIIPLILCSISILRIDKFTLIFYLILIFSIVFSLGSYTPLFSFFYYFIPGFSSFRIPATFLFVTAFSLSILAGKGFIVLSSVDAKKIIFKILHYFLGVLVGSSLALLSIFIFFKLTDPTYIMIKKIIFQEKYAVGVNQNVLSNLILNDILLLSILLTLSSILLLILMRNPTNRWVFIALVTFIYINSFIYSNKYIQTRNVEKTYSSNGESILNIISKDNSNFRILNWSIPSVILLEEGLKEALGYDPMYLQDYREFIWNTGEHKAFLYEPYVELSSIDYPTFLQLLGVKYIITENDMKHSSLKHLVKTPLNVYMVNDSMPQAYIVPNAIVHHDIEKHLEIIKNENFNPRNEVILSESPSIPLKNSSKFEPVKLDYFSPNMIKIRVNIPEKGFLVLNEVFDSNWSAKINGRNERIFRANYLFRSLALNEGINDVTLTYTPISYFVGICLTVFTFASLLVIVFRAKLKGFLGFYKRE